MARKKRHRHRTPPGAPPGTLIADPAAPKPVIRLISYSSDEYNEETVTDLKTIKESLARRPITWINVDGLGDVDVIARLAEILDLHPLAVEDTVNTHQRAKVENYEQHLFVVMHMASNGQGLETEQLSLFLGKNYVVTFQQGRPGDPFNPVRERIRKNHSAIRRGGADYLAYCLIDAVIDGYFPLLENMGEHLENLEDQILASPGPKAASRIHAARRELMALRRAVWPLREALNTLIRDPSPLVTDETRIYIRDCYDHAVRILDFVETHRELASDLMDLYLSSISQRMTEVMKVLTIIATIFIPLTFISSIYGMNFNTERSPLNMPELNWFFGYPFALSMMAIVAGSMVFYFRRKGWIGTKDIPPLAPPAPETAERPSNGRDIHHHGDRA